MTTQAAASGKIDGSFDVGGHKLHLRCEGKGSPGSPTVVYLYGLGGDGWTRPSHRILETA